MDPLRVVLTADPELPVPPKLYGGIERVVALLADGLTDRGHDVCLVAHKDSTARACLAPYTRSDSRPWSRVRNALVVTQAARRHRPDIVHSFSQLALLAGVFAWRVPKVMSYQRPITPDSIRWGHRLARNLTFTACSDQMVAGVRDLTPWRVIYNAVDTTRYQFAPQVAGDAPLVFLGRVEAIKGPHLAIEIARRVGRRLVLAGNVPPGHREFFEQHVRPYLDGDRVRYLGPVDDAAKSALLGDAAALLMPILWDEPFGIVMAEALACGTPIIGIARGAVPEVVAPGITGLLCRDVEEMIAAVDGVARLDRRACRLAAEARFSQSVLVSAYESMYREVVAAQRAGRVSVDAARRSAPAGGNP